MKLDAPLLLQLRDHLLDLSAQSVRPLHGRTVAVVASPEERAVLDRFRPFAELFYLVAVSDGRIDAEERAVMEGAFRVLTDGRVRDEALKRLAAELEETWANDAVDARLESVCSWLASDSGDAELAITLASAVALANKELAPEEGELLKKLATWLHLPDERIARLFEDKRRSPGPTKAS